MYWVHLKDLTLDKDKVKVLSVKFSKVGKKTFTDYKNLEWIVCRSHGIDNVNIQEAKNEILVLLLLHQLQNHVLIGLVIK